MAPEMDSDDVSIACTRPSRERVQFLDGIRGWMCLTVTVIHSLDIDTPLLETIVQYGLNGPRAVKIFWMVSGYTIALSADDEKKQVTRALGRFPRLFLPASFTALLHSIIVGIVKMTTGTSVAEAASHVLGVQRDLFFYYTRGPDRGETTPFGFGQLWFMHAELYGSWAAYACHSLFKNAPRPEKIVAVLFVLTMFVDPHLNYILIGYALRFNQRKVSALRGTRNGNVSCAVAMVFFFGSLYGERSRHLPLEWELVSYVGATSFFICIFTSNAIETLFSNSFIGHIGSISFELYVCHVLFVRRFREDVRWFQTQHELVTVSSILIASFTWTILVQKYIHKLAVVVTRRLVDDVVARDSLRGDENDGGRV